MGWLNINYTRTSANANQRKIVQSDNERDIKINADKEAGKNQRTEIIWNALEGIGKALIDVFFNSKS